MWPVTCAAPWANGAEPLSRGPAPSHKDPMQDLLLVALGGAIGAVGRHLLGIQTLRLFGPGFP